MYNVFLYVGPLFDTVCFSNVLYMFSLRGAVRSLPCVYCVHRWLEGDLGMTLPAWNMMHFEPNTCKLSVYMIPQHFAAPQKSCSNEQQIHLVLFMDRSKCPFWEFDVYPNWVLTIDCFTHNCSSFSCLGGLHPAHPLPSKCYAVSQRQHCAFGGIDLICQHETNAVIWCVEWFRKALLLENKSTKWNDRIWVSDHRRCLCTQSIQNTFVAFLGPYSIACVEVSQLCLIPFDFEQFCFLTKNLVNRGNALYAGCSVVRGSCTIIPDSWPIIEKWDIMVVTALACTAVLLPLDVASNL